MCLFVHVAQLQDCRDLADFRYRKWAKLFRKLIKIIDFTNDVKPLPAKLRYSRRAWRGGSRRGWGMSMPGTAERGQVWAADGRFCHGRRVTGAGGGRDSERRVSGEPDVQEMALITLVMITVLPGTAKLRPLAQKKGDPKAAM